MMKVRIRTRKLKDAAAFAEHWDEIAALRGHIGVGHDVLLSPLHFLAATNEVRRSCSVGCWRGERLIGLLYATQHYVHGMGTGYAIGGDYSGRGLLLCAAEDESVVLRECMKQVVADGIHSLHLRFLPRDNAKFALSGMAMRFLDAEIPGDRMALKPTFDEFIDTLGKHTRRNVRACIRKTEAAGIEFVPSLSREEYQAGLKRLNAEADFSADHLHLAKDERLLALHGGGERLGLRGPDGTLIAVLCGFRLGERFHLLTQLNDACFGRLSLSLVLRSYAIEHLIQSGYTELQFMGGSSLSFGRYCQPEFYRSIFIDRKIGPAAAAKLLCSRIVRLIARMGRPVPGTLTAICSGYVEEWRLSERTALGPAAVLLQQRQLS